MFVVTPTTLWNVHSDLAYTPSLLSAIGIPSANFLPSNSTNLANPYIVMSEEDLDRQQSGASVRREHPPSPTLYDQWSNDALFPTLRAVRNHKVFLVNVNLWSRARGLRRVR